MTVNLNYRTKHHFSIFADFSFEKNIPKSFTYFVESFDEDLFESKFIYFSKEKCNIKFFFQ